MVGSLSRLQGVTDTVNAAYSTVVSSLVGRVSIDLASHPRTHPVGLLPQPRIRSELHCPTLGLGVDDHPRPAVLLDMLTGLSRNGCALIETGCGNRP